MSNANCALNSDGTLKDASEIDWFHDPGDNMPVVMGQRRSGRATKPSVRVREANKMLSVSMGPVKQNEGLVCYRTMRILAMMMDYRKVCIPKHRRY